MSNWIATTCRIYPDQPSRTTALALSRHWNSPALVAGIITARAPTKSRAALDDVFATLAVMRRS